MKLNYRTIKNAEAIAKYWGKSIDNSDWYSIKNQANKDETEIMIYDVLVWPFNDATELIKNVNAINTKSILVKINSPGGDAFDGISIYNALANHPSKVITRVEGLAASVASIIVMAGNEIQMYQNTMLMIHNAWAYVVGNQQALLEVATVLDKMDNNLIGIYTNKTKGSKKEMAQMMADETWMTAKEAQDKGFIDTILESGKAIKAQFDLSIFNHVPDGISVEREGKELSEREIERALKNMGISQSRAKFMVALSKESEHKETRGIIAECEKVIAIIKN